MDPGRLGVFYFTEALDGAALVAFARRLEALGYGTLWIPEVFGREPFATAGYLLARCERLRIASGIANVYARDAVTAAIGQRTLAELSGGRFLLGLGVSHPALVEEPRGHAWGRPVPTMRAYLDRLERAPHQGPAPAEPPPIVLAALGPRMLELAGARTAGAHPYNMPPAHTAKARQILGPEPWLCVEQKVCLERDPARERRRARAALAVYLGLPRYHAVWGSLGFSERDWSGGGSDRLIDAVVAWGDERAIRQRIEEHFQAGASHVCIQPLQPDGGGASAGFASEPPHWRVLEALAPSA